MGGDFYTFRTSETILSREFSLVGIHMLFAQGVVSFPPKKKNNEFGAVFVSCSWSGQKDGVQWRRCVGEKADRWSRAENIRNWRKVRNGAFSWLPNSCNFYCHC